jgi:hypothetical protein
LGGKEGGEEKQEAEKEKKNEEDEGSKVSGGELMGEDQHGGPSQSWQARKKQGNEKKKIE